jgi:hypothetical protein
VPAIRKPLPPEVQLAINEVASRQAGVVHRRQLLSAGLSDEQVRTLVRRGEWVSTQHGVLVPAGEGPYLRDVAARLMGLERRAVISHASAALLHGLPYVDVPAAPTLTVERGHRGEPGIYVARLEAVDVTQHEGIPVTTPSRSLVDVMREAPGRGAAQALADGAVRAGLVLADVDGALRRARGWPGVRQAREAWQHADARPESPHESRCRVWFRDGDLPEPELQVVLGDETRTVRVDFLFREQRTVVEADGRVKYTDPAALWEEKLREDWLRDQGFEVVRAIWADHRDGGKDLVRRILRAFDRGARRAA